MFRAALLGLGAILVAGALFGLMTGWHTIGLLVFGGVLVLSLLFERYVYKPIGTETPGPGWNKMGERFVDPRSGQTVTVYFNARTGQRRYVTETDA